MRQLFNNKKFLLLLLLVYIIDPVAIFMLFSGISLPDFRSYYAAGALLGHGSLYNPDLLIQAGQALGEQQKIYPYIYPPMLAYLIAPLTFFSPIGAAAIFLFFNSCVLLLIIFLCYRYIIKPYFNAENTRYLMAVVIFLLPLHGNLQMGQINILVLAALIVAFIFARKQPFVTGLAFTLAVLIKMTPIGFIGLLLARKRFKIVALWLLLGGFFVAIMVVFDSPNWQAFMHFFTHALVGSPELLSDVSDMYGFSLRMTLQRFGLVGNQIVFLRLICMLLACVLLLPISFYLRNSEKAFWLLYLPFSIVMILASPITYTHHVIFILPGACAWAYYFYQLPKRKPFWFFLSLLMIAGLDIPFWLSAHDVADYLRSANLYALVALFVLSCVYLSSHRKQLLSSQISA